MVEMHRRVLSVMPVDMVRVETTNSFPDLSAQRSPSENSDDSVVGSGSTANGGSVNGSAMTAKRRKVAKKGWAGEGVDPEDPDSYLVPLDGAFLSFPPPMTDSE